MRRILATLAVVVALLFSAGAAWKAEAGEYKILGPGNKSCGAWIAESKKQALLYYQNSGWVLGYISAFNTWGPLEKKPGVSHISKGTDVDGLFAWIDNWCRANPLDWISDASVALIKQLIKRKGN